jgi:hypothetical protein
MNPRRSLPLALVLIAASLAAHGAPSLLAQTNGAPGVPAAPRTDPTITPMPEKPQAGTPTVIQPPPGAPAPKRRDQTGGKTPDAIPVDPGAAGHIDESTGPTSGARARPPEDESKRTLPTEQGDKDKRGVSTPPESIR